MARPHTRARVGCILLAALLAACGDRGPAAPGGASVSYYVDCAATAPGDGTIAAPWSSLAAASAVTLGPGDRILLRRGSTCVGMLAPQGSGAAGKPITVGAYGDGPLPRIDANGASTAAVLIADLSNVVVEDLELTNAGDLSEPHRGVYLTAAQSVVTNVELRNLFIHDVSGLLAFNGTGKSGGAIIGKALADAARFDGVLIENNRIEDVGRSGIFFTGTTAKNRPSATEDWPEGSTGLVVRSNVLQRIQGDAIVALGTVGAVIEDNVVSVGNLAGRDWLGPERNCSAGIWTYNANRTLIQRNEVSGYRFGQSATDGCDGTGFDIDNAQDGTIVQYNYSHDNEGGFILLCSDDQIHTADVRYNLSVDDGHVLDAVPCKSPTIGSFGGIRLFNNTFVSANPNTSLETVPLETLSNAGDFQFANNIVYATAPQTSVIACGDRCSNNLFYNLPPVGTAFVVADPLFEDASHRGPGRLEGGAAFRIGADSPAISAGLGLADSPQADYFGDAIPATPAIGMHQPG